MTETGCKSSAAHGCCVRRGRRLTRRGDGPHYPSVWLVFLLVSFGPAWHGFGRHVRGFHLAPPFSAPHGRRASSGISRYALLTLAGHRTKPASRPDAGLGNQSAGLLFATPDKHH